MSTTEKQKNADLLAACADWLEDLPVRQTYEFTNPAIEALRDLVNKQSADQAEESYKARNVARHAIEMEARKRLGKREMCDRCCIQLAVEVGRARQTESGAFCQPSEVELLCQDCYDRDPPYQGSSWW